MGESRKAVKWCNRVPKKIAAGIFVGFLATRIFVGFLADFW